MVDPNSITVYTDPDRIDQQVTETELADIVHAFKHFKAGYDVDIFGKDRPYDEPGTLRLLLDENVWHVHVIDKDDAPIISPPKDPPTLKKTSDAALVYCVARNDPNCYLLIKIIRPAHKKAWKDNIMWPLGRSAEVFRQKF